MFANNRMDKLWYIQIMEYLQQWNRMIDHQKQQDGALPQP